MIERMLDETDTAELRALQARAYGRDGSLTTDELARLHELDAKRRGAVVGPEVTPDPWTGSGSGLSSGSGLEESVAEPVEGSDTSPSVAELEESVAEPVEVSDGRGTRRWRWPAVAAVGALLIGLAAGWALWGWNSAESALAAAHSAQRADLEATGDFDPGTVTAISEQHGVVVWTAQRAEGKEDCVILTTSQLTQSGCGTLDETNLNTASAQITIPEGIELEGQMLSTFLLQSATGEAVPAVQIWDRSGDDWEVRYTDAELETIRRIEAAEGIDGSTLSILGYDGDTAVWSAWGPEGQCVIAEVDAGFVNGCWEEMAADSELVLVADVQGVPTRYVVHQTEQRGTQLTVVKLPATGVEPPSDDGAGAEIDDKTGETGE